MSEPVTKTVLIVNEKGLHARPAAAIVKVASQFEAEIRVHGESDSVNGDSVLGLLMLMAGKGAELRLEANGPEAEAAVSALEELILSGFGENIQS